VICLAGVAVGLLPFDSTSISPIHRNRMNDINY
jgi:hypothetical protein